MDPNQIATAEQGYKNAGNLTKQAILDLQNRNGLPATGLIGAKEAYFLGNNYLESATPLTTAPTNNNPATNGQNMNNQQPDSTPINTNSNINSNNQNQNNQQQNTNQNQTIIPQNQTQNVNTSTTAFALSSGNLRKGVYNNENVRQLQSLLGISADGDFGAQTEAAVRAFQAANGLTVDGIVGSQTVDALNKQKSNNNPTGNVVTGVQNAKVTIPTTGNPTIDALISTLNNQSPQKSFTDVYKEVYDSLGLTTLKNDYESQSKAYSDLQNEKNDEKQKINNNPWYSEGKRVMELKQLDKKYEGRETILSNKLKLLEANISNGRADAQFVSGQIMDQLKQSSKLTEDLILKAIDIAEKEASASAKATTTATEQSNKTPTLAENTRNFASLIKTGKDGAGNSFGNPQGSDGYADPGVYLAALNNWPGTMSEFLSKFPVKTYVNPTSYKLLPASIQPKTTTTKRRV